MAQSTCSRLARPQQRLAQRLDTDPELPFGELLPAQRVHDTIAAEQVRFRQCFFTPFRTLWAWLWQTLRRGTSCWEAAAACVAWASAHGQAAPAPEGGAYCKARGRLPERLLARLMRQTGQELSDAAAAWRWLGHRVRVVDGTTVTMPDTSANQEAYPQPATQAAGLGFPIVRLVIVFCLACGSALDLALGRCTGKHTGEASLLRALLDQLEADDVLLGDSYFSSYATVALLQARGVHYVGRAYASRRVDFRRGVRLGPNDHIEVWSKPANRGVVEPACWAELPPYLLVRESRVRVAVRGFRVQQLVVVTTLLDAERYPVAELAELYRARWQAELNLRSLKTTLGMDVLRCQTPEMVRKELWMHLLAYNLVRGTMVCAARRAALAPEQISFSGALQATRSLALEWPSASAAERAVLAEALLDAVAKRVVGNRPNRVEPRAVKRRPKPHPRLMRPRAECKRLLNRGVGA